MDEVRAQRTLMKSAPELWHQVSDRDVLARRLAGFGEIRITRTERQRRVTWEGDGASGDVTLEPAGWGTRVTLTARRQRIAMAPASPVPHNASAGRPTTTAELGTTVESPAISSPKPWGEEYRPGIAPAPSDSATTLESPAIVETQTLEPPAARPRGLLARLLRRQAALAPTEAPACHERPSPAPARVLEPLATAELVAEPAKQPAIPEQIPRARRAEDAVDRKCLAAMLDQLGANHHRPFSRG
jgi:hypothetical protein